MLDEWPEQINGIIVPYSKSIDELDKFIHLNCTEKWVAFLALARKGDYDSFMVLLKYIDSKDIFEKRASIEAIGLHQNGIEAQLKLASLLSDKNEIIKRALLETVRRKRLNFMHDDIVVCINNLSDYSKQVAVDCLDNIWRKSDNILLLDMFQKEKSKRLRNKIAGTLVKHSSKEDAANYFSILHSDPDPKNRLLAIELAGKFNIYNINKELNQLSKDENGHVRKKVINVIKERVGT